MKAQEAYEKLARMMRTYSGFGAQDTEGWAAISRVEHAMDTGQPFPLRGHNPWELYSSVPGWDAASVELTRLAQEWYKAGIKERLGVALEGIVADDERLDELFAAYWQGIEPALHDRPGGYTVADVTAITEAYKAGWMAARS